MVRIAGVNLPPNKRMEIALTYIYGMGRSASTKLLDELNIDKNIHAKDLSEADEKKLREAITKITTEGDLRRKRAMDIKRLQDIGSYRGFRHRKRLP
ncbi:MAG: 30S ribosomal protein S13, partial [Candidatus Gracilibacteria bacterium]